MLDSNIAQFVIIWWITLETGSALYLALASLVGLGPQVIIAPFTGAFVDRWNRKILIDFADFFQAIITIGIILLFWLEQVTYLFILTLLLLRGIFQAFHTPAVSAIMPVMVPREKLSRLNGLGFLINGIVMLIGPVIATILLEIWTIHQILWIDGITFIFAIIPLLLIKIPAVREKHKQTSFRHDFGEGIAFIKNARGMIPLLATSTMLNFTLIPLVTLLPYYIKFTHFGDATDLALIMAVFEGGLIVGGLIMSVLSGFTQKMRIAMFSLCIVYISYTLVALTPIGLFWFMALSDFITTVGIPVTDVLIMTIFQTGIPLELQGRVFSVSGALSAASTPLGMILSGIFVDFIGITPLFLGCVGLGVLTISISWFFTDIQHIEQLEHSGDKSVT